MSKAAQLVFDVVFWPIAIALPHELVYGRSGHCFRRITPPRLWVHGLIVVDASGLVIPFGLERELHAYRECREGSRGRDAGLCPRHVLAGGLVRLH